MPLSLILMIIGEAIKLEPSIADELRSLFSGAAVTPEMIAAKRAAILAEDFDAMVPASQDLAATAASAALAAPAAAAPVVPPVVPPVPPVPPVEETPVPAPVAAPVAAAVHADDEYAANSPK